MNGNAKIKGTMLGYEDHGMLSCWLYLEQPGCGQGFGGYRLDSPKGDHIVCGFWVRRILETVGVEKWEDLKGKYIRVEGSEGGIEAIGHLLEDKWFRPRAELEKQKGED